MYIKIICPVDFSEASAHGVEYAARLARTLSLELLLLNVKPLLSSQLVGGNAELMQENIDDARSRLSGLCINTSRSEQISCDSEVITSPKGIENVIADLAGEQSIIVMGTNGADDMYQYFFGTHSFNVIRQAKCPVLLVPENTRFLTLQELIFVWDYDHENHLDPVIDLARLLKVPVHFLHIRNDNTAVSEAAYISTANETEKLLSGKNIRYTFELIFADDNSEGTEAFMSKKDSSSLLVSPVRRQGMIEALFKRSNLRKTASRLFYPILFIHESEHH